MADRKPIVFISCGQGPTEKQLGRTLADLVTALTPCEGYFAEDQQSLKGVSEHILGAINACVGFVAVMHHRGNVSTPHGEPFTRGSVWVEQEIAIATFISHALSRQFPVALYIQKGIKREGVRNFVIAHPQEFDNDAQVINDFKTKLLSRDFLPPQPNVEESTVSSLGHVPTIVSLKRKDINPDPGFGVRIRPRYYKAAAPGFTASDDDFFNGIYNELAALVHQQVKLQAKEHGILFASDPQPYGHTGQVVDLQIYLQCDGEVVVRFSVANDNPIVELFAVLAVGFRFAQESFLRLGLGPTAIVEVDFYLHAGRKDYTPSLPTTHNQVFEVDFARQTFSDAFYAIIMTAYRKENHSTRPEDIKKLLAHYAAQNVPQLVRIDPRWGSATPSPTRPQINEEFGEINQR